MSIDFSIYKRTVFIPLLLLSQVAATAGTLKNTTSPVNILADDVKTITINTEKVFENLIKVGYLDNTKSLIKAQIGVKTNLQGSFKSIITSFQELKFSLNDKVAMANVQMLAKTDFSKTDKDVYDFDIQNENADLNSEPTLDNSPTKTKTASKPGEDNQAGVPSIINVAGEGPISISQASNGQLRSKSNLPQSPRGINLFPRNATVGSVLSGINQYGNLNLGQKQPSLRYSALAGYDLGAGSTSYSFNTVQTNPRLTNLPKNSFARIQEQASLKAVQETDRRIKQQKSLYAKIAQQEQQQEKLQQERLVKAQKLQEETIRKNYTQNY